MKHLCVFFLLLSVLAACVDSEDTGTSGEGGGQQTTLLGFTALEISEELDSDAQTVTATHTYCYDTADRLTSCLTRQTTEGAGAIVLENATTVTYGDATATVTDASGNTLTYNFDAGGRAATCVYRTQWGEVRHYTFGYYEAPSGKHYLSRVTETLGDASEPYSEISLDYTVSDVVTVTRVVDSDGQSFVLSFPSEGGVDNLTQLPCLFLAELYPLSLHEAALYARWLGDASDVLKTRYDPADNAGSGEYTTYTYVVDAEGLPQQCRVLTESYGYVYRRTLNYAFSR